MQAKKAAYEMNISDRKLYMCEADGMKIKDDQLYSDAMKLYKDVEVGIAYLNANLVFQELLGGISMTDPQTAAANYAAENSGDSQIINSVMLWGLKNGNEPLLDWIIRKIKNAMHSHIDLWLNIRQRDGFAY